MADEQNRLQTLLAPGVESQGCELLGVQVSRGRRHTVLRLFIDRDEGITVEDCERVSHQVSGLLDVEDPIAGDYHLEVSSPGADRPLFRREHYERFVGAEVRIRMTVPQDGRRSFVGVLVGVDEGDRVHLRGDDGEWHLPLAQIALGRLVPEG